MTKARRFHFFIKCHGVKSISGSFNMRRTINRQSTYKLICNLPNSLFKNNFLFNKPSAGSSSCFISQQNTNYVPLMHLNKSPATKTWLQIVNVYSKYILRLYFLGSWFTQLMGSPRFGLCYYNQLFNNYCSCFTGELCSLLKSNKTS